MTKEEMMSPNCIAKFKTQVSFIRGFVMKDTMVKKKQLLISSFPDLSSTSDWLIKIIMFTHYAKEHFPVLNSYFISIGFSGLFLILLSLASQ